MADNTTTSGNRCQYWQNEPGVCGNWDITIPACSESDATYYPYCNRLGTKSQCSKYDGTGNKYICTLPDPDRSVGNRRTGASGVWAVTPTYDDNGEIQEAGNFDAITAYNGGNCDDQGTGIYRNTNGNLSICTGYQPYNLGFSTLQPDDKDGSQGIDADGELTSTSGFDLRLPLGFEIYNRRALLGRCYWWKYDTQDFIVPTTLTGTESPVGIEKVLFLCTNPDEIVNEYNDFKFDSELGMYRAPCNGAKPECPRYTSNVCWEYCVDEKMQGGDKVLGEQILELRYNIRRERWDADKYEKSFKYPDIQAWLGSLKYGADSAGTIHALIPSRRVFISDFEDFTVSSNDAILVEGIQSDDGREKYPDLVEELKDVILAPIIKNVFETISGSGNVGNIFEVTSLNHETIPIFGDTFYYDAETYAINLKDPDIKLPSQVVEIFRTFDSMEDAKANLEVSFDDIYKDVECALNFILKAMPDKIVPSTFGKQQNLFYIDMPTLFGDNEIVVLNKGSGRWEFDKINVKKIFCGGVIGQTSFSLAGDGEVNYLPDYASDLMAYNNNNGTIGFTFFPLVSARTGDSSTLSYVYNDSVRKQLAYNPANPPSNTTYDMSYKLCKIKAFENQTILDMSKMRFFGNSGYVLLIIPDEAKIFTRVIKPWEVGDDIYLNYPSGEKVLMEIFDEDNTHLEPNQIILKPKHIADFRAPCTGSVITLKEIFIYEKRSFNELPPAGTYEVVKDLFVGEDDNIVYRDVEISSDSNSTTSYQITKFGFEAMTIAAVFKGVTGRIKGQTKTKMITWIRQPYCRDTEISYSWTVGYTMSTLLPEYWCFGPTGVKVDINTHYRSYTPPCGDHDLSFIRGIGPLWYPYNDCDDTANYGIISNLTEFDTGLMEVFKDDYPADPPHGQHDIRMLGPADNFGATCDTHASIWACHCDWSFCNLSRKTDNIFAGYGRYRGGLSYVDMERALQNGGSLPKFGNTYRDFLRSYRSMDNIDYYYWNGSSYIRKYKWVPMSEFYTSADISLSAQHFPYLLYCSSDYYDDGAAFVHPMGLMLARDSIENIDIGEQIDVDNNGIPIRYHFEDVFNTHYSLAGVYYPYPKSVYFIMVGGIPTPVISWYTYKDYSGSASGDVSIQWAWQEKWKDIEREIANLENLDYTDYNALECCSSSNIIGKECLFSIPYSADNCSDTPKGRHISFDIEYPDYQYDYMVGEHRLVAEEGKYEISITPPSFTVVSGASGLVVDEFFWAQMGSGPYRAFDLNGTWDPSGSDKVGIDGVGDNLYYDLYTTCTTTVSGWVDDVTLFAPGYTDPTKAAAELDGRVILTVDVLGDEIKLYYQRGLSASFNVDRADHLAKKETLLSATKYDMIFSERPTCMDETSTNDFAVLTPGDPYPGDNILGIDYCMGDVGVGTDISIEFIIRRESNDNSKDSGMGVVSRIGCEFGYGEFSDGNFSYLYHIPAVSISVDGNTKYECDTMNISAGGNFETKQCSYSWEVSSKDIFDAKKTEADKRKSMLQSGNIVDTTNTVTITFRISPTEEELDAGIGDDYLSYLNIISIKNIYLYASDFVKSIETVKVYERKYNISYGFHGDFPPHGRNNTGSLLYPLPTDKSSVYQYDTLAGVVGLPGSSDDNKTMNKLRGRIMKECHPDKEQIEGPKNLDKWESKQKKVYDDIAIDSGDTSFTLTASAPPAIEDKLNEIGLSFPRWSCVFTNTIVRPLKGVVQYSSYSPCGHRFKQDIEHMYYYPCGFPVAGVGRVGKDIFDYTYESVCSEYGGGVSITQVDALLAYYQGTAKVLTHPLEYAEGDLTRSNEVQQRIAASQQGSIILQFPSSVTSLN